MSGSFFFSVPYEGRGWRMQNVPSVKGAPWRDNIADDLFWISDADVTLRVGNVCRKPPTRCVRLCGHPTVSGAPAPG
ncbi:hypothetical protein GCM10009548_00830 [Streptomyces malaysiensis subsp. malaysiensis]